MMDIWLLFGLFKPFIDIILQTYIETLRVHPEPAKDGDVSKTAWQNNEILKINAFKYTRSNLKKITYCISHFFRSVHERIQQENMKVYFEKANKRNMRKMKFCLYFNRFIYPIFYILFIVLFWMVGLVNYSKNI